jgi:hypothetical protein
MTVRLNTSTVTRVRVTFSAIPVPGYFARSGSRLLQPLVVVAFMALFSLVVNARSIVFLLK